MAKLSRQIEGLRALHRGVSCLARAVQGTLGGGHVVVSRLYEKPIITNDALTVVKELALEDPFENLGIKILRDVAMRVVSHVGDGVATTILLAEAIFSMGMEGILSGMDPQEITQGILLASQSISQKLEMLSTPVSFEEIAHLAISTAQDEVLGTMISHAIDKIGPEGMFVVAESQNAESSLELISGMSLNTGYLSSYFVTRPDTMDIFWEEAYLLLLDCKIHTISSSCMGFLDFVLREKAFPLILIARDFSKDVLNALVLNKLKRGFPMCALKIPESGESAQAFLEDLAIFSGASVIHEPETAFQNISLDALGKVHGVSIQHDAAVFLHGCGEIKAKESRIRYFRSAISQSKSCEEAHTLKERLSRFLGGVAKISLGAETETELREKKVKRENALQVGRAACIRGVVADGEEALLRAAREISVPKGLSLGADFGFQGVLRAVLSPLRALATHCEYDPEQVIEALSHPEGGDQDYRRKDSFENLFLSRGCTPLEVTTSSLKYAVSVSSLLLTSSFFVANSPVEIKDVSSKKEGRFRQLRNEDEG
ncbi:chaperonin, 60 kDa [Chlamydia pecorum PV3056/3]|uniref:chaperonin GroEL n=1 Tax=Chlamydia pecorum TaxID=85991 RepID=UPI0003AD990E|nr:chaperonin GroEL [Chlamydia pecorum]AGW38408.1 chaperonin, 60 kDa [Chlamydia pecorum PV3056/3]